LHVVVKAETSEASINWCSIVLGPGDLCPDIVNCKARNGGIAREPGGDGPIEDGKDDDQKRQRHLVECIVGLRCGTTCLSYKSGSNRAEYLGSCASRRCFCPRIK
jgi:hypothetical protein